jgi:hypothetical protein
MPSEGNPLFSKVYRGLIYAPFKQKKEPFLITIMKKRVFVIKVCLALAVLAGFLQTARGGYFEPAATYPVGSGPETVAAADVNGDGKPDLISVNYYDDSLMVLTNDGSAGFGSNATWTVGVRPYAVAAADVNGDSRIDLISANFDEGVGNTLTVLTNSTGGRFGFNATLNVGYGPIAVVAADINGDGYPDLINVNNYDGSMSVLTNNGTGRFGSNATLAVGSSPFAVVAADFYNHQGHQWDGKRDLACVNYDDSSVSVFTNNGSGKFALASTPYVGLYPAAITTADVNDDRKMDLITADTLFNTLTILTNQGKGQFGYYATLSVGASPYSVVAADINRDGLPDLISANTDDNSLTVMTNSAGGEFGFNDTLAVGNGPNAVITADLDVDGVPDLVSVNYSEDSLSVLLGSKLAIPSLAISLTGPGTVVVSWPSPSTGFVLQQNSDLTTTNWSDYGGTINDDGTNRSVTISSATNNRFFKLNHP